MNICSVILSQSRITSDAHDRTQRERARERVGSFLFSYFLFGYETKEPKWRVVPFPLLLDKIRGRDMKGIDDK